MLPITTAPLAFVMAHRNTSGDADHRLLQRVMSHLFNQSDDQWRLFIVDDSSTYQPALHYLDHLARRCPQQVSLQKLRQQCGPGIARNLGIEAASKAGCPVIMFCDSDDCVHLKRVEVTRRIFASVNRPAVLYSGFTTVDNSGRALPFHQLTPSLREILYAIEAGPPTGMDVWRQIGTETGYINLTSATSVSTNTALAQPFPTESVSEDSHTWMRYSASGAEFVFSDGIPVKYRTCREGGGSASRDRDGEQFYHEKARVDTEGFQQAMALCAARTGSNPDDSQLMAAFYLRLAQTMVHERVEPLALEIVTQAIDSNSDTAYQKLSGYPDLLALTKSIPSAIRSIKR